MNINDFFSTPEQGRRLQELLPDIESFFVWESFHIEGMSQPKYLLKERRKSNAIIDLSTLKYPALTLQELRDVASERHLYRKFRMMGADRIESWHEVSAVMTAPELAAWVIERLEEVER